MNAPTDADAAPLVDFLETFLAVRGRLDEAIAAWPDLPDDWAGLDALVEELRRRGPDVAAVLWKHCGKTTAEAQSAVEAAAVRAAAAKVEFEKTTHSVVAREDIRDWAAEAAEPFVYASAALRRSMATEPTAAAPEPPPLEQALAVLTPQQGKILTYLMTKARTAQFQTLHTIPGAWRGDDPPTDEAIVQTLKRMRTKLQQKGVRVGVLTIEPAKSRVTLEPPKT